MQNIIDNGYIIPVITIPPLFYASNNKSSLRNSKFVSQAILKLLKNNCIEELDQKPYCCNPLTVAESKKLRLVLDLRHVNSFIKQNKFRYENLTTLSEILSEGDHFTTFDLSSGYHHIEIHPEHRKFLGFEWTFEDGSTKYFQFCVLPFGLSSACYVFTKVLRPFTKRWRGIGIKAIIYIDDGIAASRSFELAKTAGELIKNDLVSAGFVINSEKSDFNPKTKGKWLGTIINTIEMTFTVPSEKINKLLADIKNILMQNVLTPKQLAKITGQLSSMHLAIGPLVRLFTRNMYHEIENRVSWYEPKIISKETKDELEFWLNNIYIYNGYTFKPRPLTTCLVFTDASNDGYGGFILKRLNKEVCSAKFKNCEKQTSSTHRELLAVKYVLDSFGEMLRNQSVQVNIDNSSACRILSVGSTKPYLQNIAIDVLNFCSKLNIKLIPQWIPREQNELADYYSRIKDTDNWSIDNDSFRFINNLYGKSFTVDRFANNLNQKLKCFN